MHEDAVYRRHHSVTGAKVGIQILVSPCGGSTGTQVSKNIRTTEGIDRLLGVADQQQCAVLIVICNAINTIKNTVLQRIGILKFVDQRDRKLLTNDLRQALTVAALQRGVEPREHIVEAHLCAAAFFRLETQFDPGCSMAQRCLLWPTNGIQ